MKPNYKELLNHITTFIFDVDGVLTDGGVTLIPGQQPIRRFNSKDGYVLQLAIKKGYRIAVITGGRGEGVRERMEMLGIKDIYMGADNKIESQIVDPSRQQGLRVREKFPNFGKRAEPATLGRINDNDAHIGE